MHCILMKQVWEGKEQEMATFWVVNKGDYNYTSGPGCSKIWLELTQG